MTDTISRDGDMIRRGDAKREAKFPFSPTAIREAIDALPAVQPDAAAIREAALIKAAGEMLALHDGYLSGTDVNIESAKRLHVAASFGAQAFAVCPIPDARPSAMLRAFLVALMNPMHGDLDYLRKKNIATLAQKGGE
jgi:hypothetical protein